MFFKKIKGIIFISLATIIVFGLFFYFSFSNVPTVSSDCIPDNGAGCAVDADCCPGGATCDANNYCCNGPISCDCNTFDINDDGIINFSDYNYWAGYNGPCAFLKLICAGTLLGQTCSPVPPSCDNDLVCEATQGETCSSCSTDCGPCNSDPCIASNCSSSGASSANCRVGATSCPSGEFVGSFPTNQCSGPDWRCDCCGTSGGGSCVPTQSSESTCNDSIDNDCDGDTDCSDSDCTSSPSCGANNADCDVRLVSYPSTADPGSTFQVTYEVFTSNRNEHIDFRREGTLLGCIWDWNFFPVGEWQEQTTQDYSCPSTPGTYNFELRCRDHWMAIEEFCGDNNSAWLTKTFQVECIDTGPTSVGHIRIQGPSGMIKLNLISASDAISAGNGVVKVARFSGDKNSAADLVLTTDTDASPVRIMTPYGIRSWRKLP